MDGGWPGDTSQMDPWGPYRNIDEQFDLPAAPSVSARGKGAGWSLEIEIEKSISFGPANVSASGVGKFDDKPYLWDVNIQAAGELKFEDKEFEFLKDLGLASKGKISASGDKATVSLTIGGQPIEVEVSRGTVEADLRDAIEAQLGASFANLPEVRKAIRELAEKMFEPGLAELYAFETSLRADLIAAYIELQGILPADRIPQMQPPKCFVSGTAILLAEALSEESPY